jgi:hypothetical protein
LNFFSSSLLRFFSSSFFAKQKIIKSSKAKKL